MKFEPLGKKTVYQGRAFSVAQVEARLPNGNTRSFDLVEHVDSVTVIPLDDSGRILFVRQYRLGAEDLLLELPAGVQDAGEDPLTCAAREVREETGLAARELKELGQYYLAPGYSSEKMVAYLATGLYPSALEADEDEFIETQAIAVSEVYAMAARGEIQDGKSLAALLLARPHLF
ncbi:MAG TPA: NUDIX hydrolase [Anaerolineaceae bacterium]|nr:NUDIX hydrolase [Anaerolineaceae bacterium]